MPRMDVVRQNALHAIRLLEADLPAARAGERERILFDLCALHRKAGIAALLSEADVPAMRRDLASSARTRVELLRMPARMERGAGRYRCASHTAPLFDGIARQDLAKRSLQGAPRWRPLQRIAGLLRGGPRPQVTERHDVLACPQAAPRSGK